MIGFKGTFDYSIDDKGRVPVPAKLRQNLSDAQKQFVATRGLNQCINLYTAERWEEIEETLKGLNAFNAESSRIILTVYRWAEDITIDSQGRIALSKSLLGFAGLTNGTARIMGSLDHIQIWDPEIFQAFEENQETSYGEIVEKHLGFV